MATVVVSSGIGSGCVSWRESRSGSLDGLGMADGSARRRDGGQGRRSRQDPMCPESDTTSFLWIPDAQGSAMRIVLQDAQLGQGHLLARGVLIPNLCPLPCRERAKPDR